MTDEPIQMTGQDPDLEVDETPIDTTAAYDQILHEDDGDDTPKKMTDEEIERKYARGQSSIVIQRNDLLIPNILQMLDEREILDLSPQYQRRFRWTPKKQSQLIESLLMNVPIPPIFLYEKDFAHYEVMDGVQRLTTIKRFFNNEFSLSSLKVWPELNGRRFKKLPRTIQNGLRRRGLPVVIILTESSSQNLEAMKVRQYVFERLNTGGQPLNPQEVRNCIYASHFNAMLVRIARSDPFTAAWGIPPRETDEQSHPSAKLRRNKYFSTMADCAIVLRYFAFRNLKDFNGVRSTLDACMENGLSLSESDCKLLEQEYLDSLVLAQDIYGSELFRIYNEGRKVKGQLSVPLSDAVLLATRKHLQNKDSLIAGSADIIARTKALMSNDAIYDALIGSKNSRPELEDRIGFIEGIYEETIQG